MDVARREGLARGEAHARLAHRGVRSRALLARASVMRTRAADR
jgi:hypothetical protein